MKAFEIEADMNSGNRPHQPIRLLLVEDEETTLAMIRLTLAGKRFGYQVESAANGVEALTAIKASRQNPFDVVLTDFQMPNMDGRELIASLSNNVDHKPIIILMSTESRVAIESGGRTIHCDAFFRKPLNFDELNAAILRLVSAMQEDTGLMVSASHLAGRSPD